MSDAVIRSARESDLPPVERVVAGLTGSVADAEGTRAAKVLRSSRDERAGADLEGG